MPDFKYRIATADGTIQQGQMAADSEGHLADLIRAKGGVLIAAQGVAERKHRAAHMDRRELINFTTHLQTAVSSGIPILETIRGYAEQCEDEDLAFTLSELARHIESGASFGASLEEYPALFPTLYIHMVAAGEETGQLDKTLEELSSYLEWRDEMAKDMRQATVYPVVVISLVAGLIVFLLSFVLPRFLGIFEGAEMELPLATRVLMLLGDVFSQYWLVLIMGIAATVAAYKYFKRTEKGALWIDTRILSMPLFGPAIRLIGLSQLSYSLGLLLNSGVDISRALTLAQRVVTNRKIQAAVTHIDSMVTAGHSLTDAFRHTAIFPPLVNQMLAVGEDSGSMPQAMQRATDYMQREVKAKLKMAFSILEPAITMFLGIVVGGIALTIFYTLYKMMMSIGGAH